MNKKTDYLMGLYAATAFESMDIELIDDHIESVVNKFTISNKYSDLPILYTHKPGKSRKRVNLPCNKKKKKRANKLAKQARRKHR